MPVPDAREELITPQVAETCPLANAALALERLAAGHVPGKIVLQIS